MEKEKHEYNRKNMLYASGSQALAYVHKHGNIFAMYTRRTQICQVDYVNVIEEYIKNEEYIRRDGNGSYYTARQWWYWTFYKTFYEIYKFTARPSTKEKTKLLNSIIEKSKRSGENVK